MKRWSQILGPLTVETFKNQWVSKSQKLLLESGLVRFTDGLGFLSPLMVTSLRKLEQIVRKEMNEISAQEILLPTLINSSLFEVSGRDTSPDIFWLEKSGKKRYALSPTNEELICNFFATIRPLHHSRFPFKLYQITNKFRDERRAKSSLLRTKEFIMKDLYCLDSSLEKNEKHYQEVTDRYHHFFQSLNIPYVSIKGFVEEIKCLNSDEFHFLSEAGEDKIMVCKNCESAWKSKENDLEINCFKCSSTNIDIMNGIEVGHSFNFGIAYSELFNLKYIDKNNKEEFVHMSSHGLGLTRLLAASVEVLCTADEVRWPLAFVPYLICIIPPKAASKEEKGTGNIPMLIYHDLNKHFTEEVIYFDDTSITIGKRFIAAKKVGIPYIVIVGKHILNNPPCVEIHDVYLGKMNLVQVPDVTSFVISMLENLEKQ